MEGFPQQNITHLSDELERLISPGKYYIAEEQSLQIGTYDSQTQALLGQSQTIIEEDEYISSLMIYHIDDEAYPGMPVTCIELLSPANKPSGSHDKACLSKRMQLLRSEINIVKIDYLHECRPVPLHFLATLTSKKKRSLTQFLSMICGKAFTKEQL